MLLSRLQSHGFEKLLRPFQFPDFERVGWLLVAKFQFVSRRTNGMGENLVSQADPEYRIIVQKFTDSLVRIGEGRWISWTIGKKNCVR